MVYVDDYAYDGTDFWNDPDMVLPLGGWWDIDLCKKNNLFVFCNFVVFLYLADICILTESQNVFLQMWGGGGHVAFQGSRGRASLELWCRCRMRMRPRIWLMCSSLWRGSSETSMMLIWMIYLGHYNAMCLVCLLDSVSFCGSWLVWWLLIVSTNPRWSYSISTF